MFVITIYKNGRARRYRFASIDDASRAAQDIFAKTGAIVGIERGE